MAKFQALATSLSQACVPFFKTVGMVCAFFLLSIGLSTAQAADAGLKKGWDGEIALGGSLATGNTDRQALDVDVKASHRAGRFEDRYKLSGEFAREDGNTTASRINAGAQSNYDISDRFYALGFAEVERDKFSGFRFETEAGAGVGYRVVDTDDLSFDVELAPGFRHSEINGGGNDNKFFVRGSALLRYRVSDTATLANETLVSGESNQVRIEETASLTVTVISNLAARISFNIRYNSNPPAAAKKTDTVTKGALIYTF